MRLIDADKFAERINASPAFPNMGQDGYFLREIVLDFLDRQATIDIKTEVAREIFAELGKLTCTNEEDYRIFAELKNKYTKEGVGE